MRSEGTPGGGGMAEAPRMAVLDRASAVVGGGVIGRKNGGGSDGGFLGGRLNSKW